MPRLLLVEDEPLLVRATERLLQDTCLVFSATTAADAWAKLTMQYYDGLLIEVAVPGIHGRSFAWELLERIPEIRSRVLLTFGGINLGEIQALQERFARPVLYKPVPGDVLRRVLADLFSTGRA